MQATTLLPFFVATSSSPILEDSPSEETLYFPQKLDQFPAADASQGFTSPTVRYNLCHRREVGAKWGLTPAPEQKLLLPLRGNLGSSGR